MPGVAGQGKWHLMRSGSFCIAEIKWLKSSPDEDARGRLGHAAMCLVRQARAGEYAKPWLGTTGRPIAADEPLWRPPPSSDGYTAQPY